MFLKDNSEIKLFEEIEESVEKDMKDNNDINHFEELRDLPNVVINSNIYDQINSIGYIPIKANPKICFFGDKSKILILNIDTEEWKLINLPKSVYEFNYYSSAVTLPDGNILIIGGGISTDVFKICLDDNFKIIPKK